MFGWIIFTICADSDRERAEQARLVAGLGNSAQLKSAAIECK